MSSAFGQFDNLNFLNAYSREIEKSLGYTEEVASAEPQPEYISDMTCEDCLEQMIPDGLYLVCENCGSTRDLPDNESRVRASGTIIVGTGKGRRVYNVPSGDPNAQRRIDIERFLEARYLQAPSRIQISKDILKSAARQYSELQTNKKDTIIDSETGEAIGEAPWVHRGDVMKEILAALIYFTALQNGVVINKRDITELIGLPSDGFSRGENEVRKLVSCGEIKNLNVDTETSEKYAFAYLQGLGLDEPWMFSFVVEVVEFAQLNNWVYNSKLSSRVAGAIWMLVIGAESKIGRKITCQQVEAATGNIKRSTLVKLSKIVIVNDERFRDIFVSYGVTMPHEIVKTPKKPAPRTRRVKK